MPLPLSILMIVLNEVPRLPSCLDSVADLADETIVIDTGSTDGTPEVAAQRAARILPFPWCDDFAAARNESLRYASGEWVFWLDADEYLDHDNRQKLRRLRDSLKDENVAFFMTQRSLSPAGRPALCVPQVRLFRRQPGVRWEYRVHEQLLPSLHRAGYDIRWTDIVITHTGYQNPADRARKLQRNVRLLLLDQADHPDDPFVLHNLGMAYCELGRLPEALPALRRGLEHSRPGDSFLPRLYAALVRTHAGLGQPNQAQAACRQGLAHCPNDPELLFLDGQLRCAGGDLRGAETCWRQLLPCPDQPPGPPAMPAAFYASVDEGLPHLARQQLALLCQGQGRHAEAETLWHEVLAQQPESLPAWVGLGELYLAQQRWQDLEQAAAHLDRDPQGIAEALTLRGRACLAHREFAAARDLLAQAVTHAPQAALPHLFLSQALLQGEADPAAAERTLRELLALDPRHASAWRDLALLLRRQGRLAEAVTVCQSARAYGTDPELLLLHGILLHEAGDLVNAETALTRLLADDLAQPSDSHPAERVAQWRATACHNLALICRRQGRLAEAEVHWQAALEATPELYAARVGLGELHLMQGRPAEAEALLAHLEASPEGARAAVLLRARLHLARREYEPARAVLERVIADNPRATEPLRLLSYVLLQEDRDRPAAERALRDLLAVAPDDAEARHNLAVLLRKQGRLPAPPATA